MRCSYYKKENKSDDVEAEEAKVDYRIRLDLNKHNWLVEKLKNINACEQNNEDCEKKNEVCDNKNIEHDTEKSKMSGIIDIKDFEYQLTVDDISQETEVKKTSPSPPLPLPVQFTREINNNNLSVLDANNPILDANHPIPDANYPIPDNFIMNLYEVEAVCNAMSQFSKSKLASGNEPQTVIKHNLPLSAPPQREKYNLYVNKLSVINGGESINDGNCLLHITPNCNAEIQTEECKCMDESHKNYLDYFESNNISVAQLDKIIKFIERKDIATMTDLTMKEIDADKINNGNGGVMAILQACSLYNKAWIALHNNRNDESSTSYSPQIEKIKLDCMKQSFEKLFGPTFGLLVKSYNEGNGLNTKLPDVPENTTVKKRKSSVLAIHDPNYNNEKQTKSVQNIPLAKNPPSQTLQKLTYPTMPQMQEYPHISPTTQAANTNYINRDVADPRNCNIIQQYQCPQFPQMAVPPSILPHYHTGPRMMQPHAAKYAHEQHTECRGMGHTWNYSQQHPGVIQKLRPPCNNINSDQVCPRVMPMPEYRYYQQHQLHNNAVHNMSNHMTGAHLPINMRPNGHM